MTFVPLAGGIDINELVQLKQKVGQYVILINDVVETGKRLVYTVVSSFRRIRKLWESLNVTIRKNATVYAQTGVLDLASTWHGVTWKQNPTFNGQ